MSGRTVGNHNACLVQAALACCRNVLEVPASAWAPARSEPPAASTRAQAKRTDSNNNGRVRRMRVARVAAGGRAAVLICGAFGNSVAQERPNTLTHPPRTPPHSYALHGRAGPFHSTERIHAHSCATTHPGARPAGRGGTGRRSSPRALPLSAALRELTRRSSVAQRAKRVEELKAEALPLFVDMRRFSAIAHEEMATLRERMRDATLDLDAHQLSLANLQYQRQHLQREIRLCQETPYVARGVVAA